MKFWSLWFVAMIVAAIVVYFFAVGLSDGTVSSFNLGLWVAILLVTFAVTGGSLWLKLAGRQGWASLVASVLAVPGLLAALFLIAVLLTNPRWN
ncbi:osmoprotectant transporter permease [Methylotetracoccus oryzae]|uniref:osmoprotectant transporter permease n=1 Tax=Methylotetracoccus oryzae TaxID=1919059 RepID=UPI00111B810D|nr:osmoprotectant transporter permease [Methylotetracoccus oryzae]